MAIYFNNILNPFGSLNIASFYLNYYSFIDALVYLILFLSLAQAVFTKVYKDNKKEAKMIAVSISLALTFSMAMLELNTGFNIGQLAPVALFIFLLVLAVLLYNLMLALFPIPEGQKVSMHSAALTYLIIYGLLIVPFGALYRWIETNAALLSGVLGLAGTVAFVYLIIELFSALGLGGKSKKGNSEKDSSDVSKLSKDENDTSNPDAKKEKEYPENIKGIIGNEYASAVETFSSRFRDYAHAFNQIIHAHKDAARNPSLEPNGDMWLKLVELRSNLTQAMDSANKMLDAVRRQDKYSELNSKDISMLNEIMSRHGSITRIMIDYENSARESYNIRGEPPTIPAIP